MRKLLVVTLCVIGMLSGCSLSGCSMDGLNPFSSDSSPAHEQEQVQDNHVQEKAVDQMNEAYTLTVHTIPNDAHVRFKYYSEPFQNGMAIPDGRYTLVIEKQNYGTVIQNITVSGIDMELRVVLYPLNTEYSLQVNPDVKGCDIKILNIKEKYKDGIMLENGKYLIQVSKPGFEEYQNWIVINGSDAIVNVKMEKFVKKYALLVKPNVADAKIRILNIKIKYADNIKLPVGKYFIDVQKSGYQTFQTWVRIVDKDVVVNVDMLKI